MTERELPRLKNEVVVVLVSVDHLVLCIVLEISIHLSTNLQLEVEVLGLQQCVMDVTKSGRIVVLCYMYFIYYQHKNVILVLFLFLYLKQETGL